jgi:hypothetical protein
MDSETAHKYGRLAIKTSLLTKSFDADFDTRLLSQKSPSHTNSLFSLQYNSLSFRRFQMLKKDIQTTYIWI